MISRLSFLNPYWLWALLALPAVGFITDALTSTDPKVFEHLQHPTGEFAARFLIISLLATPLMYLLKSWRGPRWLRKNRRYFGVAAFGYAALHLGFYLIYKADLGKILTDISQMEYWLGWIAFVIFLALAVTSSDYAVRKMGTNWKLLQRLTYPAAIMVALHWLMIDEWKAIGPVLVHFGPLALLEAYRISATWHLRAPAVRWDRSTRA